MNIFNLLKKSEQPATINYPKENFIGEYLIVATNCNCRKNNRIKRIDIVRKSNVGDDVVLERFQHSDGIGLMVVLRKNKYDIGEIAYGTSDYLFSQGKEFVGYLSEPYKKNSFNVRIYKVK